METWFVRDLNVHLGEDFRNRASDFIQRVVEDADRITNILGLLLQNYASGREAAILEHILSTGESAYSVLRSPDAPDYFEGCANLKLRVPELVQEMVEASLDGESLLKEAWFACYARNPDFE